MRAGQSPTALILARAGMMGHDVAAGAFHVHVSLPVHERRPPRHLWRRGGVACLRRNVLGGELNANIWDLGWRPIFLVNLPIWSL